MRLNFGHRSFRKEPAMFKLPTLRFDGLALAIALTTAVVAPTIIPSAAQAEDRAQIDADSHAALQSLYANNPTARLIASHARGILIFPKIVKAGLGVGGAYGEGEGLQNGGVEGYYNSVAGTLGLQAGVQTYGYAVFLMSDKAVQYLHDSDGWEIGVGPSVVVVDEGVAKNLSTTTLKDDAYAFAFDQKGLMAGVSLEGTKVTKIKP